VDDDGCGDGPADAKNDGRAWMRLGPGGIEDDNADRDARLKSVPECLSHLVLQTPPKAASPVQNHTAQS